MFNILTGFNFPVLAGLGKIKERVKILVKSTLLTILFTYGGINLLGLRGAGLGFGISYFLSWRFSFPYLLNVNKFSVQWCFIIKNLIMLSILGIMIYLFKHRI